MGPQSCKNFTIRGFWYNILSGLCPIFSKMISMGNFFCEKKGYSQLEGLYGLFLGAIESLLGHQIINAKHFVTKY